MAVVTVINKLSQIGSGLVCCALFFAFFCSFFRFFFFFFFSSSSFFRSFFSLFFSLRLCFLFAWCSSSVLEQFPELELSISARIISLKRASEFDALADESPISDEAARAFLWAQCSRHSSCSSCIDALDFPSTISFASLDPLSRALFLLVELGLELRRLCLRLNVSPAWYCRHIWSSWFRRL